MEQFNDRPRSASFGCRCGEIAGRIANPSPRTTNRIVCYCADCQTFAHALGRPDVLDSRGGTDIIQAAPAALTLQRGRDRVTCLRLSVKGLYRFHSSCCGTPLGNVVGPSIPFIGIARQAFEIDGQDVEALFGPIVGEVQGQSAIGGAPPGTTGVPFRLMMRALLHVLRWKLTAKSWPHPYFDRRSGTTPFPVVVLGRERLGELRSLCGPNPTRPPLGRG